jgi:hypothetical protein
MTVTESSDPPRGRTDYDPNWLDNLADDVTGEGAAMQGVLHGAEAVEHQEFQFTGKYGDNGFLLYRCA